MSDTQIPILTKPPEDTTEKITAVMTELADQSKFLSDTLNKSIKFNEKIEKKNDIQKKKDNEVIKSDSKKKDDQTIKSDSKKQDPLITSAIKSGVDAGTKSIKLVQDTFLGDISFVTDPLKKVGSILGDVGGFFGLKKKKVAPKRSNMLKTNPESVYMVDALTKSEEKGSLMDKLKGFLPALLGGGGFAAMFSKLGPMIMKAGGIGMIVGSLVWMAIDGFKAYAMAGKWGVSKTSAVIGGVLGGTGKGWKNAFKGMGKWALMGAGIGTLVAPGVGTLIGGLLGAAVGGILGFIGGEKIAKAVGAVGRWFKDVFWGGIKKGAMTIGTWFIELPGMLAEGFKEGWEQFKSEMGAVADFAKILWDKISPIFTSISGTVTDIFKSVVEGVKSFIEDPIGFGKDLLKSVMNKITSIFDSIKQGFSDFITDPVSFTKELLKPIKDFFGKIGSIFGTMFGWLTGYEPPEIDEKAVSDAKENSGYNQYFGGMNASVSPIPHNDVILRPDGSVHTTNPDDTIIATKNPIAFADKESSSMTQDINKPQLNITAKLESLIQQLIQKQQIPNQSNMVQQNITSRYSPQAIMANLTTEVF